MWSPLFADFPQRNQHMWALLSRDDPWSGSALSACAPKKIMAAEAAMCERSEAALSPHHALIVNSQRHLDNDVKFHNIVTLAPPYGSCSAPGLVEAPRHYLGANTMVICRPSIDGSASTLAMGAVSVFTR